MPATPVPRPTLRCVLADLGQALPPIDLELQNAVEHQLLYEMRRLAPDAPTGMKRVLSIEHPMVYRVQHSRWRGAAWLEIGAGVFWLCAAETREEGSADDAYEHFERLHRTGELLPAAKDYTRLKAERLARVFSAAQEDATRLIRAAQARAGRDLPFVLANEVSGRLHATEDDELWVAISRQPASNAAWLTDKAVFVIFAAFQLAAGATAEEQRIDWPDGDLAYHEVAKFFL
jgi:hypothetical protein